MHYTYAPKGVCCQRIQVDVGEDGIIQSAEFYGGCPGNGLGVCQMVRGKAIDEVILSLEGIDCGGRGTSCPDQLARMLREVKKKAEEKE